MRRKLRARATSAGKQIRCPKCQQAVTVPAPQPAASSDPLFLEQDDPFSQIAPEAEVPAITLPPVQMTPVKMTAVAKPEKKPKAGRRTGGLPFNPGFGPAALLCVVAGAIGAGIWYGIAVGTGVEIGYVAWAVGGIVGAAFAFGNQRPSGPGALLSAGVAVGSILLAKIMIFNAIFVGGLPSTDDDLVRVVLARQHLAEQGTDPNRASNIEIERARREIEPQFQAIAMSDRARIAEEMRSAMVEADITFFDTLGVLDVVFLLLAMATAFGIANKGLGGG
ncbi:MAG: hypothetical protein KDA32_11205 [Phycisphaerales bacterium]|nr:hypothetical protein [Phycisphaerales bacterium]